MMRHRPASWLARLVRSRRGAGGLVNADAPLRSELFSTEQMEEHGRVLAAGQKVSTGQRSDRLRTRLAANESVLRDSCSVLAAAIKAGQRMTPAGEWLLDNLYLIEEQIRTARRHFPARYGSELPRLERGPSANLPRVYDIALNAISHGDGRVDQETLSRFIAAYQSIRPLTLGELWAIPIMLRLALIENLRRVAWRVRSDRYDRNLAGQWADAMIGVAESDPKSLILVVSDMARSQPPARGAFVAELVRRLQGHRAVLALPLTWIEQRLQEVGMTIDQVVHVTNREEAADQVSISNSIGSLRLLSATDWRDFVESASEMDRVLREDPSGTYPHMDFRTRDDYRGIVERIARKTRMPEIDVARIVIALAKDGAGSGADERHAHIGYYLIDDGLDQLECKCGLSRIAQRLRSRRLPFPFYFSTLLLVGAVFGIVSFVHLLQSPLPLWVTVVIGVSATIALSQLAVALVNQISALTRTPRPLPRMETRGGIASAAQTLVVVPSMLTSIKEAEELADELEIRFLANRDPQLCFALLTDFGDAATAERPADAAILAAASRAIVKLNERHSDTQVDVFYLLHRPRRWSDSERSWIGFERKRGKLGELNALLRGHGIERFSMLVGNIEHLRTTRYVITLDSDTQLPRDCARDLVATMEHPLNRPVLDADRRRVIAGYGILQPRIGTSFAIDSNSRYAMLFGGDPGLDPYTRAVSDTYQDLFGEGSFTGKGIYDVDAFEQVLANRFPLNRILSHDLLEGAYARSGLITDVTLYERYPPSYRLDAKRRERWTRGDWQIAEWLFSTVPSAGPTRERNPLSGLSLWKIFDNLRRSLVAPALLIVLLLGWFKSASPVYWTLLAVEIVLLPALLDSALGLVRKPTDVTLRKHLWFSLQEVPRRLIRLVFEVACLPTEAIQNLAAITRTWWRVHVSRQQLLQWVTSRQAESSGSRARLPTTWITPFFAVATAATLGVLRADAIAVAAPWLLLWLLAPAIEQWLSGVPRDDAERLDATQVTFVRGVARRTWAFFEHFVGDADHWLPPDNYQEYPIPRVAHRTSPTNIGLSLLANLSAFDLGYLSANELLGRTSRTLASLARLERHRGHFYNWYDTTTLQPLLPLYVSTVDSGNLVGHLWTLQQGLVQLAQAPVVSPRLFEGLADTFHMLLDAGSVSATPALVRLRESLASLQNSSTAKASALREELRTLTRLANDAVRLAPDSNVDPRLATFARLCEDTLADVLAWLPDENPSDSVDAIPVFAQLALQSNAPSGPVAEDHKGSDPDPGQRARTLLQEVTRLSQECASLADVDWRFLYDWKRHLFAIGYDVREAQRDSGFYDLLASEARLGIFSAIANDQIPQESWFALGRVLTSHAGAPVLLSWSGSMFEYLMPLLVMPNYQGSLLARTCQVAVARQIDYAKEKNLPWGISESGYNLTDAAQNYQYRAFGVPGLGLQRGLSQELVIAPYASALALMVMPRAAADNLADMAARGWLTYYGFFEAIDFTPTRQTPGSTHTVVQSFMAHHQGMSLVACAQAVLGNSMQRRFDNHPPFQATLLLLQERVPRETGDWAKNPDIVDVRPATTQPQVPLRVFRRADTRRPPMQLLSNGSYHVMVTVAGGGYSRWRNIALTRWREDVTCDPWGTFVYLLDCMTGRTWSTTFQPITSGSSSHEAVLTEARVEFRRHENQLDSHTEIVVSPEDDIELRRTRITNRSRVERMIEITSYAEVVLAPAASDDAHPAFSNLFVQTEFIKNRDAIICTRRPRSAEEAQPWMLHLLAVHDVPSVEISHESDRMAFIGRGRSSTNPIAMTDPGPLSGTTGSVLDPIVAVRHRFRMRPDQTVCIDMVTGFATNREHCLALADKYHDRHLADRVLDLAWTHSRVALGQINVSATDAQTYGRLAECIVYVDPIRRAPQGVIASNRRTQSGLWAHSISGDLPIVLLRIADAANIEIVRQLVKAHAYCRLKGLAFDLLIWNEEKAGYRQTLHDEIQGVIAVDMDAIQVDQPGGVYVRPVDQINHEDRVLMQSVARIVLFDDEGSLVEQLRTREVIEPVPSLTTTYLHTSGPIQDVEIPPRILQNGIGGFSSDGREYVIAIDAQQRTPAPWVNVIANPVFGFVVSESGSGYTWFQNAHEYRLTPWSNDPVCDPCTEAFYIRDEESGHYWSPTPLPCPGAARYLSRHGFGYSVFETIEDGIASELRMHVDPDAPVKFFSLRLHNDSGRVRRLSVTGYVQWVLGDHAAKTAMHVVTEIDASGAMLARNSYSLEFPDHVAFFDVDNLQRTMTGDRTEFIGRNFNMASPAAMGHASLSGRVGARLDPCGAIQVPLELADGESRSIVFRLGAARDREVASAMILRVRKSGSARAAFDASCARWNELLGAVSVTTPDQSLNALVNGWLLYQVISCRMWGRSGFYQSGGAFGFRDQLQDSMALVHTAPELLREQILLCASRQFREGDVQHWWHPPSGRGVRTLCSDDYLWLPLATCRYLRATSDWDILGERTRFLDGRALNPGEESYYDLPMRLHENADLYGHCVRAIEHGLRRGSHGLPLIGTGDWNDGMNNVGRDGRGESVWLGFFLYSVLIEFADVAVHHNDLVFAKRCTDQAEQLRSALEQHGWDGGWYRRAYFDDGAALGTASAAECRIDSIAQSWAVLSGAGDPQRSARALDALDAQLVDPDARLIKLLDPPFDHPEHDPGYIRGYLPGVRENGGQYTHAAIWAVMAFAQAGRGERAWQLFDMINPVRHGSNAADIANYRIEPYVVAADVMALPPHVGRGGWSWYTGAAGWMYRLILESLLGVRRDGNALILAPVMPREWPSFSLTYRTRTSTYEIEVSRDDKVAATRVLVDGTALPDQRVPLEEDGATHRVTVIVGTCLPAG